MMHLRSFGEVRSSHNFVPQGFDPRHIFFKNIFQTKIQVHFMKRGSLCPVNITTGQCVASQRCSRVCQTHKNESKCASKFICALTVYCASETTVRLLDGLEQVENYEGRDGVCEEWVFTNKIHLKKHFDIRPLKLYILKLNWSFSGLGDSLDN